MSEYLTLINNLRATADKLNAANAGLENKLNQIITGDTIKERYTARKENVAAINTIGAEMDANNVAIDAAKLAIKIAVEMYAKEAANRFIDAIKAGTKNLIDTPMHYKKFKAAAAAALAENDAIITSNYYTVKVNFVYYGVIGHYEITALYTSAEGVITAADAEKAKKYEITPAAEIEKIAADAMQAKKDVERIKENAKKEIDAIKARFDTIYAVTID